MSSNKYICIAPIKTECGGSRIEIGVEVVRETNDAISEAQIKVEPEEVAPTASVFLAEHVEPEELRACRVCLEHGCKLYSLRQDNLVETYREVTSLPIHEDDIFPQYICVECTTLLNKCQQFIIRSKMALTVLKHLATLTNSITMEQIRNINREANNLTSCLSMKQNPPEHCDHATNFLEVEIKTEHLSENEENVNEQEEVLKIETDHNKIEQKPNEVRIKKSNKKKKLKPGETPVKKEAIRGEGRHQVPKKLFKGYFVIEKMTFEEQLNSIQMRKESVSYKVCAFKCDVCFEAFDRKTTFDLHTSRHSEDNGTYICQVCQLRFSSSKGLSRHVKLLHLYRYNCTKCSYTVDHCQGAKKHLRFHQGKSYIPQLPRDKIIKTVKVEIKDGADCSNQEQSIKTEGDCEAPCKDLQEVAQDDEHGYQCNSCDKRYKTLQVLYYHKMAAHSGEKLYDCAQCGKHFAWYSNLKKHIRNLHKNNVFACTECNKTFKSRTGLNQHVRHVHEKKPWPNTVRRAQLRLSQRDDCTDTEPARETCTQEALAQHCEARPTETVAAGRLH